MVIYLDILGWIVCCNCNRYYSPWSQYERIMIYKAKSNHVYSFFMLGECVSLQWLGHNDYSMIHGICGRKDCDKTPLTSVFQKLSIKDIISVFHSGQLSWSEHVQHTMSCIKSLTDLAIPSTRGWENLESCPNVWKMMSKKVTPKTEVLGESVFYVTRSCQPYQIGHTQHPNLKWISWWRWYSNTPWIHMPSYDLFIPGAVLL